MAGSPMTITARSEFRFLRREVGTIIQLDVTPSTTITELKEKIQRECLLFDMELFFAGKKLMMHQGSISSEHIYNLSTVDILHQRRGREKVLKIYLYGGGRILSWYYLLCDQTIGHLKDLIGDMESNTGIPLRDQNLVNKGAELRHDDRPLTGYYLQDQSCIMLAKTSKYGDMRVSIEVVPTGKIIQLEVQRNNTIGDVKALIQKMEDIPEGYWILYFPFQLLTCNQRTLNDYLVNNGAVIRLVYAKMQIYAGLTEGPGLARKEEGGILTGGYRAYEYMTYTNQEGMDVSGEELLKKKINSKKEIDKKIPRNSKLL
ncbi:polyubiquitin-B [Artemisia annua]|uniref:Polyubiquitin-B n=1 Tax=Artemisia annua TaxID=35608 RepID=A0A2U1NXC3_ARTAN|nr:polyubiquitin-B [Artemisia annua]